MPHTGYPPEPRLPRGPDDTMDVQELEPNLVALKRYLKHILPPLRPGVDPARVVRTLKRMGGNSTRHNPITSRGRWRGFPQDPTDSKGVGLESFRPLQDVVESILKANGSQPTDVWLRFHSNLKTSNRNSHELPDAYVVNTPQDGMSSDVLVVGLLEKGNEHWDAKSAEWKLRQSAWQAFGDPRRRHLYAFTIQSNKMSLWYIDRTEYIVSEEFNFITDHQPLVHFFLSLMYAEPHQLGFDPTVRPVANDEGQYDIDMHLADGSKTFRTRRLLSQSSTVWGNGTCIWEVIQVEDGRETGEPMILKDVWAYHELDSEGQVAEELFAAARPEALPLTLDKMLIPVVCHGDVYLDAARRMLDCTHTCWNGALVAAFSVPALRDRKDILRIMKLLRAQLPFGGRYCTEPPVRVHYRVVFKDIGTVLVGSAATVFRAIGDAALALKAMHATGWLHQDVSPNNILLVEGRGVLTDLEYAIRMGDTKDRIRQCGTTETMAYEVFKEKYYFLPKRNSEEEDEPRHPTFHRNPLHDLESLWWSAMIYLSRYLFIDPDERPRYQSTRETRTAQRYQQYDMESEYYRRDLLFKPGKFAADVQDRLPTVPDAVRTALDTLRGELSARYVEAEKNLDALDHTCADGLHERFHQILHDLARDERLQSLRFYNPHTWFMNNYESSSEDGSDTEDSAGIEDGSDMEDAPGTDNEADTEDKPDTRPTKKARLEPELRVYLPRRAKDHVRDGYR